MNNITTESFINWCDDMMIAEENTKYIAISDDEIRKREQSWRHKLPNSFKAFIKQNNGKIPDSKIKIDDTHYIDRFLSISSGKDSTASDIDVILTKYNEFMAFNGDTKGYDLIPFAELNHDSLLCLCYKSPNPTVVLWKMEGSQEFKPNYTKCFDTFDKFLNYYEKSSNSSNEIAKEAAVDVKSEYRNGDIIPIKFFGKPMQVKVHLKERDANSELIKMFNGVLKKVCNSKELWSYLYSTSKSWIEDVNDDPYFKGKTCKSTKDLIDAVEKIDYIGISQNAIWVCGEYWIDPEHGFSIAFPNGKFVRSTSDKSPSYDSKYNVTSTGLGQYGDAF